MRQSYISRIRTLGRGATTMVFVTRRFHSPPTKSGYVHWSHDVRRYLEVSAASAQRALRAEAKLRGLGRASEVRP